MNWLIEFFVYFILLEINLFGEVFHDYIKFVEVRVDEKGFLVNGIDSERFFVFLLDKFQVFFEELVDDSEIEADLLENVFQGHFY